MPLNKLPFEYLIWDSPGNTSLPALLFWRPLDGKPKVETWARHAQAEYYATTSRKKSQSNDDLKEMLFTPKKLLTLKIPEVNADQIFVQSLSCVWPASLMTAAHQASLPHYLLSQF